MFLSFSLLPYVKFSNFCSMLSVFLVKLFGIAYLVAWMSLCWKSIPSIIKLLIALKSISSPPLALVIPIPCFAITCFFPSLLLPTFAFTSSIIILMSPVFVLYFFEFRLYLYLHYLMNFSRYIHLR